MSFIIFVLKSIVFLKLKYAIYVNMLLGLLLFLNELIIKFLSLFQFNINI